MSTNQTREALDILKDSMKELQSEKGSILAGVQKLSHAANLLGENDIAIWCEIQLGNSEFTQSLEEYINILIDVNEVNNKDIKEKLKKIEEKLTKLNLKRNIHYSNDEISVKAYKSGGGYQNIGFIEDKYKNFIKMKKGNDGTYYLSNLSKNINFVKSRAFKYVTDLYDKYKFSDTPQTVIDVLKGEVDDKLLDLNPTLAEKLMLMFKSVSSNNKEELSQSLTTCRRFIESLADVLYPATDEKINGRSLGQQNYINRIWAFMDKSIESTSNKEMAKAHVDYLGLWLQRTHKISNKGVHTDISKLEATKAVLHIYLILADILNYLEFNINQSQSTINIHKASLDELQSFLDISKVQAKDIVKMRVIKGKIEPKDLLKIKGIGSKTVKKAEDIFSFDI
ncbi:MAG: helix-hairpin-helix domain-containing protein [Candidatus Onthovivens sp.]|nr:helix-hairpin-helix domain-containing protein [Candidatus Onthovivens sp.]